MRKFLMLTTTALLISIASLGQGTQDTILKLPKPVAREAAKDLIRCDSIAADHEVLKQNYLLLQTNISLKDTIIKAKNTEIDLWKTIWSNDKVIMGLQDKQLMNANRTVMDLNNDLKKTKRKKTRNEVVGGAVIAGLAYLLVKK
jgi:hypothetical protein